MSDFTYNDDIVSETPEEIEPVSENATEEPIVEEVAEELPAVEEVVIEEPKAKKKSGKQDSIVLFSKKTISWEGVGQVKYGFNIVSKDQADKWLTKGFVRLATEEEASKELKG